MKIVNGKFKYLNKAGFLGLTMIILISCKQLGLEKDKTDNTSVAALVVAASQRTTAATTSVTSTTCTSSTSTGTTVVNSTATLDATTGCVSGIATCMDSAL